MMELADVVDSKSATPITTAGAITLDSSRFLTTQYVSWFLCPSTMSLRFLGQDIGRRLKILNAGVSELADETDSKSVIRKGVWVRVPPPAPDLNSSQTLDISGFAGFSLCSHSYVASLAHKQICHFRAHFRRDIGGTLSIKRRDIRLKLRWQTQPLM